MFGHRWLHLRLSKAPRRVFIDSPDRPVNLSLKHPPRPHVRSGWLDWRLWLYGFICWSTCKPVEWNPCRWMMSSLGLSADWMGVNAAAASFLSTFSHSLFSYLCWTHVTWVSSSAPPWCTANGRRTYACVYCFLPPPPPTKWPLK